MSAKPKAAIPAGGEGAWREPCEERPAEDPFFQETGEFFRPGGARRLILGAGKAFVYMSDDGTEIVTERPDGTVKRRMIEPAPHGKRAREHRDE